MRIKLSLLLLGVFMLCFSACGGSGSSSGGFFSPSPASVEDTYSSEFSDIPIPSDMKELPKQTYLVINPDGSKSGAQVFEGSVKLQSLMNAMIYNMMQKGWVPRSVFKGERCAMVFEKDAQIAVVTGVEGYVKTTMDLWVARRIQDGVMQTPELFSDPVYLAPVTEGAL